MLRKTIAMVGLTLTLAQAVVAASPKPLYERLGGEAAIRKVVDDFVAAAAPDPKVDFTRGGTWQATPAAVEHLKQQLVAFLGQAFGGPQKYQGRDMRTAHSWMKITQAQFDALAGHLKVALEKNGVGKAELDEVMRIAASTAPDIVTAK